MRCPRGILVLQETFLSFPSLCPKPPAILGSWAKASVVRAKAKHKRINDYIKKNYGEQYTLLFDMSSVS